MSSFLTHGRAIVPSRWSLHTRARQLRFGWPYSRLALAHDRENSPTYRTVGTERNDRRNGEKKKGKETRSRSCSALHGRSEPGKFYRRLARPGGPYGLISPVWPPLFLSSGLLPLLFVSFRFSSVHPTRPHCGFLERSRSISDASRIVAFNACGANRLGEICSRYARWYGHFARNVDRTHGGPAIRSYRTISWHWRVENRDPLFSAIERASKGEGGSHRSRIKKKEKKEWPYCNLYSGRSLFASSKYVGPIRATTPTYNATYFTYFPFRYK